MTKLYNFFYQNGKFYKKWLKDYQNIEKTKKKSNYEYFGHFWHSKKIYQNSLKILSNVKFHFIKMANFIKMVQNCFYQNGNFFQDGS